MSSPTFSDALSYVVDAQAEILSAVADWKSYADAAAEAYSQAYEDQGRVLGSVNQRLEEMRKEDAERMTLALTILTVGVAGPIASVLVKGKAAKVFEKLAENLQGKASKTALEAVRRVLVDQLQFPASAINQTGLTMGRPVPMIQHDRIHQVVVRSGGAGGVVRRDADESARAPVCGDPDESKFAECDVQEAGDCPGG